MHAKRTRVDWVGLLPTAAEIVESYDTPVTLRQLFYQLVARELLPNTTGAYKTLSARTAAARRAGLFPALFDGSRRIRQPMSFADPFEARLRLREVYRRDRTEGQEVAVYLGVEKNALAGLLEDWFEDFGVPIIPLGGYSSQTFVDDVAEAIREDGRPAVIVYAGDFDPSGEDIERDFRVRTGAEVQRIALSHEQVLAYDLPPQMGKATDARAAAFEAKHGRLIQVELDALPADELRRLYQERLNDYMDLSIYRKVLKREEADRLELDGRNDG